MHADMHAHGRWLGRSWCVGAQGGALKRRDNKRMAKEESEHACPNAVAVLSTVPWQGGALKRRDGKRVAKEEAAAQAALRGLAGREAHWDTLERARLELESLRMLLERIGRREKVKRQREAPPWTALHDLPSMWPHQEKSHAKAVIFAVVGACVLMMYMTDRLGHSNMNVVLQWSSPPGRL